MRAPAYDETLASLDYAVYLQDRWALLSNLYLSAGVRWELQDLRDIHGDSQALIWDNVARSYSARDCDNKVTSLAGAAHPRVSDREQPTEWCVDRAEFTTGALGRAVVPRLRGQFNRQLQIGYEHELIDDLIVGPSRTSRPTAASTSSSPTLGSASTSARSGPNEAAARRSRPSSTPTATRTPTRARARSPARSPAANSWSRPTNPISGAINIGASSQYDAPELIRNSFGPLAGNVPHRLKLDGYYSLNLGAFGRFNLGASVRAQSGAPVSLRVGSTLPGYRGAPINYLLPRGAGGRLAPNYQPISASATPTCSPTAAAARVVALETELAKLQKPPAQMRDPEKVYHRWDRKGLEQKSKLPWASYMKAVGAPKLELINVSNPEFVEGRSRTTSRPGSSSRRSSTATFPRP